MRSSYRWRKIIHNRGNGSKSIRKFPDTPTEQRNTRTKYRKVSTNREQGNNLFSKHEGKKNIGDNILHDWLNI